MAVPAGPDRGLSAAPPVVALRPLGIGEMLDAAIKVYRSRPRQLIVATTIVVAPAIVLQTLVQLSAGDPQSLTETDAASGLPTVDGSAFLLYLGGAFASVVVLLVANSLALAGTTRISVGAYLGDTTDWRDSLRFAVRRSWPLLGVLAITSVGLIVGFVLCIAPGLWLQGIWAVAVPALLVEDRRAIDSLRRSNQLVKGHFWRVLGAILLGSLLASLLQGILTAPVLGLQFAGASFLVTSVLLGVVQLIGVALTTPYVAALTAVVYVDLRVRKEAFDLELLAGGVGVAPPPPGSAPPVPTAPASPPGPVAPPGGWVPAAPPGGWGGPVPGTGPGG